MTGAMNYKVEGADAGETTAPALPYLPREPKAYRPRIALIGCGGITPYHLDAYRRAGYNVVALCDMVKERAEERRRTYYPDAEVFDDYHKLLERGDIDVIDAATHPAERAAIIEDALISGRHVLSQKPFVTDLDVGERLVRLAADLERKLAVNQNGRWAPHFSYIREAIKTGLLGEVYACHLGVHWDHSWTAGTVFDEIHHLILYDFAIHWFDMTCCIFGDKAPLSVFATTSRSPHQKSKPPLLAQALVTFERGQASLIFDGHVEHGPRDLTYVAGTRGSIRSEGPDLGRQAVTLVTAAGVARPALEGEWFTNGFHGAMAELLCAIEEDREPLNSARDNLKSLALCFAAIQSAETAQPQAPGAARRLMQR